MLAHLQSPSLAKAACVPRRALVVTQARLATRKRGVTQQRLEETAGPVTSYNEPIYAKRSTPSYRRPARIAADVPVPARKFPSLISFPANAQTDVGETAKVIKEQLLENNEALIVVNGSQSLMAALDSICAANKVLLREARNMQVAIKPRSLGSDGFRDGNFVLEAVLVPSSFPPVGNHLDAPSRFNARRAAALVSEITSHPAVLMTAMGEASTEAALMTLAVARSKLEADESGSELLVMTKTFGDDIAAAESGYALYVQRAAAKARAPVFTTAAARSSPSPSRRRSPSPAIARTVSPTRRGAAWRLSQDGDSTPSAPSTPAYSAPSTPGRAPSAARRGAAWRLSQMSDSVAASTPSYSAPARATPSTSSSQRRGAAWRLEQMSGATSAEPAAPAARQTSSNERALRSASPVRRGAAWRLEQESGSAPASSASAAAADRSVASKGRVRRGTAWRLSQGASEEAPRQAAPSRESSNVSPTKRRGGVAARLGL